MSTEIVWLLSAEVVLVAVAVLIYLGGAFVEAPKAWGRMAAAAIVIAAAALAMQHGTTATAGPVAIDSLGCYARWLVLAAGGLLVLLASRPLSTPGTPEYVGSLLLAIAGGMLVSVANELVLLFVALELISIPTYVLLYLGRRDAGGQESAVKYFFLSILSSAMLLYGFAFLYGTAGSTELGAIRAALAEPGGASAAFGPLVKLALVSIFAGLGLKIAAVPFHFYAPDVYQGTTHANAALLSVVPKAAGLIVLVRVVVTAMPTPPEVEPYAWRIASVLAVLTMTLANVVALWQDHLRRLLAYSSIAQTGYMLIALAAALASPGASGHWDAVGALLFYLCVYAVATIGAFAVLDYLGSRDAQVDAVEELAGLGRTRPLPAAALGVFLLSLAGTAPLAGFWGKLAVFASALSVDTGAAGETLPHWFTALVIIGALNAVIAAAYYLRIVAVMYFRTPLGTPKAQGGAGAWATVTVCAVLTIGIGLCPGPLLDKSNDAGRNIIGTPDLPRTAVETRSTRPSNPWRQRHARTAPACP